jgi:hypothetical protein
MSLSSGILTAPGWLLISNFARIMVCFLVREDVRKSVSLSNNGTAFQQETLENPGRICIHEEFV